METSDLNTIYIYKNIHTDEPLSDDMLVEYWFLPPRNLSASVITPSVLFQTYGFQLNTNTVHSVLFSSNENEVKETNADAVLVDYLSSSAERKIRKILSASNKPVIYSLKRGIRKTEKIINEAKKLEQTGVSAILTSNLISNSILEKIKKSISIPVISKSDANPDSMISRHRSGADMICIMGMEISRILVDAFKQIFPLVPVLSSAGNSEEIIANSLTSKAEAIIYKPWVHINYFT
jgi:hypothetical protein